MIRWVTLAANQWGDYAFLLPISAMAWRRVAHYEPLAILTETREHWQNPTGRVVLDMIERMSIRKHYVGSIKECYPTSVAAQMSRQHVASLKSFDPEEYVLTADTDMIPLVEWWFNRQDWTKDLHIWYANAWASVGGWFTTGYIGAKVKTWREFMRYEISGEMAPTIDAALERHYTEAADSFQVWFADEHYTTSRIKAWTGYPSRVQLMERSGSPPRDRLDRSSWTGLIEGKVDAHVLRPAFSDSNWPKMREFLKQILPASDCEHIDGFHSRYMAVKA